MSDYRSNRKRERTAVVARTVAKKSTQGFFQTKKKKKEKETPKQQSRRFRGRVPNCRTADNSLCAQARGRAPQTTQSRHRRTSTSSWPRSGALLLVFFGSLFFVILSVGAKSWRPRTRSAKNGRQEGGTQERGKKKTMRMGECESARPSIGEWTRAQTTS